MKIILNRFSFNGVATRTEWWLTLIGCNVLIFGSFPLDSMITGNDEEAGWVIITAMLASFWIFLATQVRRWHDRAKSGYWVFFKLIPLVGPIWAFIELGFLPSVGDDPYGVSNDYR